ncbi:ABC-2 type transporter [Caldicellulosiruptor saccharolyticus DSM 8903]|uniref:ABC-2 type transporter n=1 Tax=Caldicellulosiruptor saccharolyticus (strain ATCC 43494 / DSM 8903 / Tp8T 6331) TaxID=351627 RepID=A4XLI5_CALS8|nr:ABC-2 type transporter [Caldicellulosiruptor saccharolyticus DSM 8903]
MNDFSIRRFVAIAKKEFIQIKRDKASFVIAFVAPFIMLMLFGYAVKMDVENVSIGILDMAKTQESRELIRKLQNTRYFKPTFFAQNQAEIESRLDSGKIKAALIIPSDFTKLLKQNKSPEVLFIVDGTDPTIAKTVFSSGILTIQNFGEKNYFVKPIVDVRTRVKYNPSMKSELFTIPGLMGLIMQNITIILTAFAIVREREKGTMEQLIVTPIKSIELILGKLVPYTFLGLGDFLVALLFGILWFKVPVRGNILLLFILGMEFVICALMIGMLISSVSKTQLQAMQFALLFLLPSVLLSGFMFPREEMPAVIRFIGNFVPLTYFLIILRGIVLKGVGIEYLWDEVLVLIFLGLVLLFISIKRFSKRLD